MITGIGADFASVSRFLPWLSNPRLTARFFHPAECAALASFASPRRAAEFLAGRFAAKEALLKACPPRAPFRLADIAVRNAPSGAPVFAFEPSARAAFNPRGALSIHLSLSHDAGFALAFAAAESPEVP